jgi:hypothetical protein
MQGILNCLSMYLKLADWLQAWRGRAGDMRDCVALICWCLWRYRKDIVFEGASPSPLVVIRKIHIEAKLWKTAGIFRAELALVDRWRLHE